jgi:hypothetical protein
MLPHAHAAQAAVLVAGSTAYIALLHNWFFKPYPSVHIEHDVAKREAKVNFTTLTATPCATETTVHHGLPCLEKQYTLLPVTSHAVAGEPMFRVLGVSSPNTFEEDCEACKVSTEISYRNEIGFTVRKNIPWTHSMTHVI